MTDDFQAKFLTEQKELLKELLGNSIVEMNRHFGEPPEKKSAFLMAH